MGRYVWQVDGNQFSNLRFVPDDYILAPNEREGWTDGALPKLEDLPGYVPPAPPVPEAISFRQFYQAAAMQNIITQDEALAAARTGAVPAIMQAIIDRLPPGQQFAVNMLLASATEFDRHHPLVPEIGHAIGKTDAEIDDFWRFAATL